jgi:hypothetical protein
MTSAVQGRHHVGHGQAGADDQHARAGRNVVDRAGSVQPVLPGPAQVAGMHGQARPDARQRLRRQGAHGQHHHVAEEIGAVGEMDAEGTGIALDRDRLLLDPRQRRQRHLRGTVQA